MKKPFSPVDDCDRPACDDIQSMYQAASSATTATTTTATGSNNSSSNNSAKASKGKEEEKSQTVATATAAASAVPVVVECPPNSAELGRGTWQLLHSMAAWYPDEPSDGQQKQMTDFFSSFATFYPCPWCATDFQANLEAKPVKTTSRKDLCQWLCEQHNLVNTKIGKPLYPCDMKSLDERWRKSTSEACRRKGH